MPIIGFNIIFRQLSLRNFKSIFKNYQIFFHIYITAPIEY